MDTGNWQEIENAKKAALEVLLHNSTGPYHGLPRTAAWGYPEPYTRDLMLSVLGIAVSGNEQLTRALQKTLETLSENQSLRGHIPSLVHDPTNRGASDSTPLFLMATGIFRKYTGQTDFLEGAVKKALTWMEYQSPSDQWLVAQQPTSDWRDEQWVLGFGLYVNTLVYSYLKILGHDDRAAHMKKAMRHFIISGDQKSEDVHEGLVIKGKPYYAFWSYKIFNSQRFDLLGNSIAILSGLATPNRAHNIIAWVEDECESMRENKDLSLDLAPNFFPFILPGDPDWILRYSVHNNPGDYHNGGIWPFVSAFYIAALVAAGKHQLARQKLFALTKLVKISRTNGLQYGFNEWYKAQNGQPMGQDWQTWSASLYLYAAKCVEQNQTPFFSFSI